MQFDADLAALVGVASSAISYFVGQGVMREKLVRLERDRETDRSETQSSLAAVHAECEKLKDSHVSLVHFDAVIDPMRKSLDTIQRDLRELLMRVKKETE